MPRQPANRRPSGLVRLIAAMVDGIDRTVNPGDEGEIPPGTPLTDWRTAALAVGCRVKLAKKAMADPAFLADLKTATDDARWLEEPENIATLITTRDDRDMPADVRLNAIKAIRPAEPVHSVTARETSWRARNPRATARKQAQTIAASRGAIIGTPQLPPPPVPTGFIPAAGYSSLANAEATRYEAAAKWGADPAVQAYTGPPCAPSLSSPIENAFKGESSRALRERFPPPPKPKPKPFRLGGPRVR